jgi:hypothetical protein
MWQNQPGETVSLQILCFRGSFLLSFLFFRLHNQGNGLSSALGKCSWEVPEPSLASIFDHQAQATMLCLLWRDHMVIGNAATVIKPPLVQCCLARYRKLTADANLPSSRKIIINLWLKFSKII